MQTIESLKRNIQSAQDLLGVVKTMKALAAVSIRQYQKAVESLSEYNRTVEMGLQVVLKRSRGSLPRCDRRAAKRMGAIVFGTDQGLCGQFNNIITAHALGEMNALGIAKENRIVISVGLRAADILEDSGQKVLEILEHPRLDGRHHPHGAGHHLGARGLALQATDRQHGTSITTSTFPGRITARRPSSSFPSTGSG